MRVSLRWGHALASLLLNTLLPILILMTLLLLLLLLLTRLAMTHSAVDSVSVAASQSWHGADPIRALLFVAISAAGHNQTKQAREACRCCAAFLWTFPWTFLPCW